MPDRVLCALDVLSHLILRKFYGINIATACIFYKNRNTGMRMEITFLGIGPHRGRAWTSAQTD